MAAAAVTIACVCACTRARAMICSGRSAYTCTSRYRVSVGSHNTSHSFFDGYCSTVQGLLDWFEVDLGLTLRLKVHVGSHDTFHSNSAECTAEC